MENNFLNIVNSSIGENARFVRDFKANPDKYIKPKETSPTEQMMAMMGPMLMMMLFQMMSRQNGSALASVQSEYFPPLIPKMTDLKASTSSKAPTVTYLEELLAGKTAEALEQAEIAFSDEDLEKIRADLDAGTLKPAELGQALKYQVDKAPGSQLPAVSQLLGDLIDTGKLDAGPFLQNDYLAQLTPERRDAVLTAVASAGLRLDSGKSNLRFIGFLLDNLNRDDRPQTQALLRRFLQAYYDTHAAAPDTPAGKTLTSVLTLAGLEADETGKLQF